MRMILASGLLLATFGGAAVAADKVQIGDKGIFPESLTSTADGTLIVGSVGTGQIYKAAPGATTAESWIAPATDGPASVLGVYADEKNGNLWACYSDLALFSGAGKGSILRSYELSSGALKTTVPLGDGTFCNDIATAADGTAFIADTAGSQVFKVAPGASSAEVLVKDEALASVDGLSFAPDGALYLNGVSTNKLFRLAMNADGSAGALTELTLSQEIKGPDGMRFGDDGVLYLAENAAGRVSAVTFDGDTANIKVVAEGGWDMPVAVTKNGSTQW
ncbi:SMP-30/gluconolactonase/LRE family protein, partial [Devosia sp.]|uniref:SMP-30/gluconolactonase/LRE family protein n=1 Tax=Devosia sp. TaxID=1871048 RepID=UPI001AD0FA1E